MNQEVLKQNQRDFDDLVRTLCDYEVATNCPHNKTSAKGKDERCVALRKIIEYVGFADLRRYYNIISEEQCRVKVLGIINLK